MNSILKSCAPQSYDLTQQSLYRLRLFSILALTGFPIFSILEMFNLLDGLSKPLHLLITLILLMSCIPLLANRFYNHLFRYKGRLDEREKASVRRAMSFSYKAISVGLIILIVIGLSATALAGMDIRTPAISVAAVAMVALNIALWTLFLPVTYIAWTEKPFSTED